MLAAASACVSAAPHAPGTRDTAARGDGIASIPRQRSLSGRDREWASKMDYRPLDLPGGYTPGGDLIVMHVQLYTAADVVFPVCDGTGFYLLPRTGGRPRPMLTGDRACDAADEPAVAPDGTWLVYSARMRPHTSALLRLDLATGVVDTLPAGCRSDLTYPSISPDGSWIAAVGRCRGPDQTTDALYTLRADGSDLREIVAGDVGGTPAAWAPDGLSLAFEHEPQPGRRAISVAGADGAGTRVVAEGGSPAWSPDGKWIAFLHGGDHSWERDIYVIRPDGTGRRQVFVNPGARTHPRPGRIPEGRPTGPLVWSPDSRWIVFARGYDAGTSIWRVDAESGNVRRVTRPGR
jgi:Tol biopolymer transport system component